MKRYLLTLAFIMWGTILSPLSLHAETIYGEGVVTFEIRDLSSFSKLAANDSVHVYFGDIGEETVKIQAEQNLLPYIYTKVSHDTLHIDISKNIKPSKQINIYLGIKQLSEITTTGTVILSNEKSLKVDTLKISASGISQVSLPGLDCEHLQLEMNGSSTVTLKGTASKQEVNMTGATVYKALGLITNMTTISISGAGKAWVNAKDKLNITLTGAAYLGYQGDPEIQKSITGVGRLEKINSL